MPRAGWSVEDDVLHIRNYNDVKSLDPALMFSGSEGLIGNSMYLSLVQFNVRIFDFVPLGSQFFILNSVSELLSFES